MLDRWLEAAGLARLAPVFAAQEIEQIDLKDLTEEDLRELGLTIGERKRFRRALETSTAIIAPGEVRPLTLAFFDLVDSSALCERLDVEEMMELLRGYRECCCAEIAQFGGHVAHLLGDGILAYFGYPAAHEDDCERAVRAALAIAGTVPILETPVRQPLAVRCGIATGRVVVTELFSGWAADRQSVTGSTANVAARLQAVAPENGIVVAESVAARVSHLFHMTRMPPQRLKGLPELVGAWRVDARRGQPGFPNDVRNALAGALIGREPQHEALRRAWDAARAGKAQVALVLGGAGIGKSRLVQSFIASLETGADPPAVVSLHASALDQHSPLRPVLGYFKGRLRLSETATDAEVIQSLGSVLPDPRPDAVEALSAFFAPASELEPDAAERRRVALDSLAAFCAAEAARCPVIILIEDAHWLDASTKDLVGRVMVHARDQPLLVLATSRGSHRDALADLDEATVHVVPVTALAPDEVRRMAKAIFGEEPVPQAVIRALVERTDGVPLFIEELLRPLIRPAAMTDWSALIGKTGHAAGVPETLQDAMTAHLDALGADKQFAQVAAVLGPSVDVAMLARVIGRPAAEVAAKLEALCKAGVLRSGSDAHGPRYAFRHALLCDAAYDSLLRRERRRLHLACAEALRDSSPTFCDERPDVVAHHLAEGGRMAESLPFWLAAGRSAAARSALHEAQHALEQGYAIAESLPRTAEMVETLLDFAALLGPVLFALRGPGSDASRAVYARAVELMEASAESRPRFPVLWGWWRLSRDFREMYERAGMLMRVASRRGDTEMLLQAHHCNWASSFHAGEFERCREHIERGLSLYSRMDCDQRPWLFGNHDAKVCALGELAQLLWMRGQLRSAAEQARAALDWARRDGHVGTLAHVADLTLLHGYYRRDAGAVRCQAERLIAFAEDSGMPESRARGHLFLGWAVAEEGDARGGLEIFEAAYRQQRAVGTDEDMPIYVTMLADILNQVGDHARALAELLEISTELDRLGIRNWAPEIQRLIAVTRLRGEAGAAEAAAEAFAAAEAIAEGQGAPMLALRVALSRMEFSEGPEKLASARAIAALRASIAEPDDSVDIRRADSYCLAPDAADLAETVR